MESDERKMMHCCLSDPAARSSVRVVKQIINHATQLYTRTFKDNIESDVRFASQKAGEPLPIHRI